MREKKVESIQFVLNEIGQEHDCKIADGSGHFGQLHAKSEHIKQNVHAFRKPKVFHHAGFLFSARAMYKIVTFRIVIRGLVT